MADQELTRRALAEVVDADLRVVGNGESALDYLHRRDKFSAAEDAPLPDLMLLDLNMPRVDGRQVLRHMRSDPRLRRIPVVVLTTSCRAEDVVESYTLGCNSFITKPADLDGLIRAVRGLTSYWFELVTLPSDGGAQ